MVWLCYNLSNHPLLVSSQFSCAPQGSLKAVHELWLGYSAPSGGALSHSQWDPKASPWPSRPSVILHVHFPILSISLSSASLAQLQPHWPPCCTLSLSYTLLPRHLSLVPILDLEYFSWIPTQLSSSSPSGLCLKTVSKATHLRFDIPHLPSLLNFSP